MELKLYFQILLKKWWVAIPTLLITFIATVVLTFTQPPTYESQATFIVSISETVGEIRDATSTLNLLSREEAIAGTYAEIAMSRLIRREARQTLGISTEGYRVASRLLAGTNVLEVSVQGPDPNVVRDLTNQIGEQTIQHGNELYTTFRLSFLDEAVTPIRPISPNIVQNLLLGAVLGLILGTGLAFLVEYLTQTPIQSAITVNIMDPEIGVYNQRYFMQRLSQEMIRAKRNRYPLSLALIRIDNLTLWEGGTNQEVRTDILRQVGVLVDDYLREEDVVAFFNSNVFSCLLPDTTGENAKALMEYIQTRIAWTPFQSNLTGVKFNLKSIIGIVTYNHDDTSRDELIDAAKRALELAEVSDDGQAHLVASPKQTNAGDGGQTALETSQWQL